MCDKHTGRAEYFAAPVTIREDGSILVHEMGEEEVMASRKHEMVFNEIDKTVRASLGIAFSDDQELAIRKAIISAFIAYENFDLASVK